MKKKREFFPTPGKIESPSSADLVSVEYFDVLFTKHLHQRQKIWDDGFLEWHTKTNKVMLYNATTRANCIDSKFFRTPPDLSPGEEFRLNKFLVQIEKRRLEGKSSVKREKAEIKSKEKGSTNDSTISPFKMGPKTGLGIQQSPMLKSTGSEKGGFPKRGRKKFVCPQKVKSDDEKEQEFNQNAYSSSEEEGYG